MRKLYLYAFVAMFAAALVVGRSFAADDHAAAAAAIGQPAPQFTLQDQNGKTVNLSDYAGKIVVLEWFNNQCPFVVKFYSGGNMNEWAKAYAEKDVVWLAINSTTGKTNEDNAAIAAEWKIDRPILNDSAGEVGHAYGATNTPHMYIIDAQGNLAYMGAIDSVSSADAADIEGAENYVAKALDELLAGTSVSKPETKAYGCSVKYGHSH